MSIKIMSLVWELNLPPSEKFVLLAYTDHSDHEGKNIYPAVATIAWKTGLSERTVQRATKELEKKKFLIADGQGPNGTNKWKFGGVTPCQGVKRGGKVTPETLEEEGNVFKVFEENISPLTRMIGEELGVLIDEHSPTWVIAAIREAALNGKRSTKYIGAILKRWKVDGYGTAHPKANGNGQKPEPTRPAPDESWKSESWRDAVGAA